MLSKGKSIWRKYGQHFKTDSLLNRFSIWNRDYYGCLYIIELCSIFFPTSRYLKEEMKWKLGSQFEQSNAILWHGLKHFVIKVRLPQIWVVGPIPTSYIFCTSVLVIRSSTPMIRWPIHSRGKRSKSSRDRSIQGSEEEKVLPSPTRIFATSRDQCSLCLREGLRRLRELASMVGGAPGRVNSQLFQTPSDTKGSNSEEVSEGDV